MLWHRQTQHCRFFRWDWIDFSCRYKQENIKRKQKKCMTTTIAHDHCVFFSQVTPCRYKTPRLVAQWSGRLIHVAHTWCERQQVFFTEIDDILCLRRMSTLVLPTARAQAAESDIRSLSPSGTAETVVTNCDALSNCVTCDYTTRSGRLSATPERLDLWFGTFRLL